MSSSSTRAVHLALHVVPGAAVAVAAILALATRTANPVGARIYGGPPGPDGTLAWRVVVLERDHGYYAPLPNMPVRLQLRADGRESTAQGTTNNDGAWEARIAVPSPGCLHVDVVAKADDVDRPIVEESLPVSPPAWAASFKRLPARAQGRGSGSLDVSLLVPRGAMAAGFPEDAVVRVTFAESKAPAVQTRIRMSGEGFSAEPEGDLVTNERGEAHVRFRADHHSPRVELKAEAGPGADGTWEGVLPVVAGSLWVDPKSIALGRLRVASPVSHRVAYLTFFSQSARLYAMQMKLAPDATGGAWGETALPSVDLNDAWVLASPDPQGQGQEADLVAWPLRSPSPNESEADAQPAATMRTPLLADGLPAAVIASRAAGRIARARILALLAAAAVAESILLLVRARQSRLELRQLLASQADVDEALLHAISGGERFWLKLLIATVLIAAGFTALALVLWMKL